MSYGRGYNTADADIFSSLARNSPQGSKSISFATKEDDDPYGTKKSPYSKTAGTFGQTGASRRKDDTKKYGDDVDDLLNMIEGKSDLTSTQKKPPLARSPTRTNQEIGSNKFLDEFMEDDVASSVYVPMGRQDRTKSQTSGYDDINKKKSALFGLSDPALSLKTTPSQDNTINMGTRSRPLTSDPKPQITTTGPGDSEIGEINLTVSRRAGRGKQPAATKDNTRPFTSAGIIERPESQFSDDRSLGAETPGLARRQHRNLMEEEDDGDSDYLSGIMNRDRADSKKSLGQGFGSSAYGTEVGGRRHLGVDNQTVPGDGTPRKSDFGHSRDQFYPHSQNTLDDPPANRRDFTFPRTQTAGNIKRDYYDTASQLMSHTSQAGSITNIGGGRRNRAGETAVNRSEGAGNRMEDDIANLVRMQQQNTGPVGGHGGQGVSQNALGTPMRDASILIQEGLDPTRGGYAMHDTAGKEYLKETEEFYKKRMKEAEEYYEKRFEDLKRAMEDEKKKWEASYTKEIELLKKEKEDLKESVKVQVERERDRMKEIFNLELESKEKTHKYELEKQRHLLEEQNEGLKRQLEAQTRLNSLADEVRASSNKLISLTDRLEQEKGKDGTGKKNELFDRERRIEENEIRMKHEQATWESEKKRLEKLRNDIENRESEVQKTLERERELLRKEYQRLTELQNSIKDQEVESKRKVESERKAWEHEKNRLEKENNQIKEDYREKYHQFELKAELFETQKVEFQSMIDQSEMALREKHEEADNIRKRLAVQEAEMLRRTKLLEHKEMISRKETDEVQSKLSMLEMERLAMEKEKLEMRDVAGKAREDADAMSRFRREYEIEKEKNMQLRLEMDGLTRTLHNEREKLTEEKNSLGMLHKTLEGIRYNYVKGMTVPEPTSFLGTGKPSELASFGKENKNDPFGFRKVGTMLNFTEGLAQNRTSPVKTGARPSSVAEKYRQTHDNTMSRPAPVYSKENYSDNVPVSKGRSTVGLGKEIGGEKMTTAKPFNYKMFMDQLKQYDSTSSNNQMYIANEKEGLMKNKIDFAGSGSLARLKSLGNTDSSLRSSPKFKNSIPLNRYDKVEDL